MDDKSNSTSQSNRKMSSSNIPRNKDKSKNKKRSQLASSSNANTSRRSKTSTHNKFMNQEPTNVTCSQTAHCLLPTEGPTNSVVGSQSSQYEARTVENENLDIASSNSDVTHHEQLSLADDGPSRYANVHIDPRFHNIVSFDKDNKIKLDEKFVKNMTELCQEPQIVDLMVEKYMRSRNMTPRKHNISPSCLLHGNNAADSDPSTSELPAPDEECRCGAIDEDISKFIKSLLTSENVFAALNNSPLFEKRYTSPKPNDEKLEGNNPELAGSSHLPGNQPASPEMGNDSGLEFHYNILDDEIDKKGLVDKSSQVESNDMKLKMPCLCPYRIHQENTDPNTSNNESDPGMSQDTPKCGSMWINPTGLYSFYFHLPPKDGPKDVNHLVCSKPDCVDPSESKAKMHKKPETPQPSTTRSKVHINHELLDIGDGKSKVHIKHEPSDHGSIRSKIPRSFEVTNSNDCKCKKHVQPETIGTGSGKGRVQGKSEPLRVDEDQSKSLVKPETKDSGDNRNKVQVKPEPLRGIEDKSIMHVKPESKGTGDSKRVDGNKTKGHSKPESKGSGNSKSKVHVKTEPLRVEENKSKVLVKSEPLTVDENKSKVHIKTEPLKDEENKSKMHIKHEASDAGGSKRKVHNKSESMTKGNSKNKVSVKSESSKVDENKSKLCIKVECPNDSGNVCDNLPSSASRHVYVDKDDKLKVECKVEPKSELKCEQGAQTNDSQVPDLPEPSFFDIVVKSGLIPGLPDEAAVSPAEREYYRELAKEIDFDNLTQYPECVNNGIYDREDLGHFVRQVLFHGDLSDYFEIVTTDDPNYFPPIEEIRIVEYKTDDSSSDDSNVYYDNSLEGEATENSESALPNYQQFPTSSAQATQENECMFCETPDKCYFNKDITKLNPVRPEHDYTTLRNDITNNCPKKDNKFLISEDKLDELVLTKVVEYLQHANEIIEKFWSQCRSSNSSDRERHLENEQIKLMREVVALKREVDEKQAIINKLVTEKVECINPTIRHIDHKKPSRSQVCNKCTENVKSEEHSQGDMRCGSENKRAEGVPTKSQKKGNNKVETVTFAVPKKDTVPTHQKESKISLLKKDKEPAPAQEPIIFPDRDPAFGVLRIMSFGTCEEKFIKKVPPICIKNLPPLTPLVAPTLSSKGPTYSKSIKHHSKSSGKASTKVAAAPTEQLTGGAGNDFAPSVKTSSQIKKLLRHQNLPNVLGFLPDFPATPKYPPGIRKPPVPILKLKRNETGKKGMMVYWSVDPTPTSSDIGDIEEYQLFVCQEHRGNDLDVTQIDTWRLIGNMKAFPLPMACFITEFIERDTYHFIVRAVDCAGIIGDFSNTETVIF